MQFIMSYKCVGYMQSPLFTLFIWPRRMRIFTMYEKNSWKMVINTGFRPKNKKKYVQRHGPIHGFHAFFCFICLFFIFGDTMERRKFLADLLPFLSNVYECMFWKMSSIAIHVRLKRSRLNGDVCANIVQQSRLYAYSIRKYEWITIRRLLYVFHVLNWASMPRNEANMVMGTGVNASHMNWSGNEERKTNLHLSHRKYGLPIY